MDNREEREGNDPAIPASARVSEGLAPVCRNHVGGLAGGDNLLLICSA